MREGVAAGRQVLLGLYFFFFGWAVGQRQGLLVMPVATAACTFVLWAAAAASGRWLPRYRCPPPLDAPPLPASRPTCTGPVSCGAAPAAGVPAQYPSSTDEM